MKDNIIKKVIKSLEKKFSIKWGHRDLNPNPGISLVSVLQLIITTGTVQLRVYFFKDNWSPRCCQVTP